MAEKDLPSSSNVTADTTKLEGVIVILTILIKIGKYLPWIVLAFAVGNLTLAVFYFTWWNSMAWGILNLVLAVAGFVFFAQLVRRRKIHREKQQIKLKRENYALPRQDKVQYGIFRFHTFR